MASGRDCPTTSGHVVCSRGDQPIGALIEDLKARGLLEDTLLMWWTEFGRTSHSTGGRRDRNGNCFTVWPAESGVKPGHAHGQSDEFGSKAAEGKTDHHDFHATVLHLLGIDHTKLTFRHNGIDRRLTDVHGRVIQRDPDLKLTTGEGIPPHHTGSQEAQMKYYSRAVLLTIGLLGFSLRAEAPKPDKDGWYDLFDGKSLDDWKAAEDPKAFKVEDGLIVAGPSKLTHLNYAGPIQKASFKNFELKTEVKTRPKASGD